MAATPKSTLRTTLPSRKDAIALSLSQFAFALIAVCFAPPWWGYPLAAICFCLALLFLVGPLFPQAFVRGVSPLQNGFEVWRPLRRPLFIAYSTVVRVVAVSRGDGDESNDLSFLIYAGGSCVPVPEVDFYGSGVMEQLQGLPGFVQTGLKSALSYETRALDIFLGKRFTIYESKLQSNT